MEPKSVQKWTRRAQNGAKKRPKWHQNRQKYFYRETERRRVYNFRFSIYGPLNFRFSNYDFRFLDFMFFDFSFLSFPIFDFWPFATNLQTSYNKLLTRSFLQHTSRKKLRTTSSFPFPPFSLLPFSSLPFPFLPGPAACAKRLNKNLCLLVTGLPFGLWFRGASKFGPRRTSGIPGAKGLANVVRGLL
jgi:hypothetical protein